MGFSPHLPLVLVVPLLDSDLVPDGHPSRLGVCVRGASPVQVEGGAVLLVLNLHRHIVRGVWLHCQGVETRGQLNHGDATSFYSVTPHQRPSRPPWMCLRWCFQVHCGPPRSGCSPPRGLCGSCWRNKSCVLLTGSRDTRGFPLTCGWEQHRVFTQSACRKSTQQTHCSCNSKECIL